MLADAAAPIAISEAKLPVTAAFSGGDAFARDSWTGTTTLAARLPAEPRYAIAHTHEDVNSFMLVYNKERLLVDPGHTCYRNLQRDLDVSANNHNTCTFETFNSDNTIRKTLVPKTIAKNGASARKLNHKDGLPIGTDRDARH